MTNIIMYHKKLDGRGAMCGWQRLGKYNGVAIVNAHASVQHYACVFYHCKPFC